MSDTSYGRNSPYAKTPYFNNYLDLAVLPVIPKFVDDVLFTINGTYQYRPDLLAYDLYGDNELWWVFAIRNPNVLKDPIFDMRVGNRIFLPKKTTLSGIISR